MNLRWNFAALAFGALLIGGCRPVPLPVPVVSSTQPVTQPQQAVTVRFAIQAGEQPVACATGVEALGATQSPVQFNDLRFYVSNVHLIDSAGAAVPLELEQDGLWQTATTALLDFEDGTAGCADTGTPELNDAVKGSLPAGDYTGISFDLGVPFELNHQDVTTAASPLNLPPMWWNWQGGYKFVRVDMKTDAEATAGAWFIHLGSTGCAAENQATAPATVCARPNLADIRLDGFDPAASVVVADLATLLADVDLSQSTPQPPGCMSGPDDPDCVNLMPAFGLDPATGVCAEPGCPTQKFFRIE